MAWVGLAMDAVDLLPVVSGLGEATRAIKTGNRIVETADDIHDTAKAVDNATEAAKAADKSLKNARRRAVSQAWVNEADMVRNTGKGTRNWSSDEITELLNTGKVKGYDGHHMKSVKKYPHLAGDPHNIQFLTRQKHFEAHGFNWRNPTNQRFIE